jgi:hypothetical protein
MIGGKDDFQTVPQLLVFNRDIKALALCKTDLENQHQARENTGEA